MKNWIAMGICLLFSALPVQAQTLYVSDIVKITLRTGPGADHRVIAMIQSGEEVAVIQTEDEWTQVRLADGQEGWVLSRLLTSAKPKILLLDQTTERNEALAAQISDLRMKNEQLIHANKGLESELAQIKNELQKTGQAYEALQRDSAQFLNLQSKLKKSAQELQVYVKKADTLQTEIEKLRSNQNLKWFLIGAGVVLLGFLLGLSVRRQPRRYMVL